MGDIDKLRSFRNGVHGEFFSSIADELEKLREEKEQLEMNSCDVCSPEDYGWVFNRVEGRAACVCMQEAEPFQILEGTLDAILKASTGENQISEDFDEFLRWLEFACLEALRSVDPLKYRKARFGEGE